MPPNEDTSSRQDIFVRQICKKYLGKGKDVYFAFLDLEKAYDKS